MTAPPFSVDKAEHSPGLLLWQVTADWQKAIREALKPLDITHVQFVLLASLGWLSRGEDFVTQVQLARHAHLDVMMTSQVLRTLEEKGFLERKIHPKDVRAKALSLTKKGEETIKVAVPAVETADKAFFARSPHSERDWAERLSTLLQPSPPA